jgi:hypothetical protein
VLRQKLDAWSLGCTLLELYATEASPRPSATFAADQRKRIEDAKGGAVDFGTGIAQVEELLNALLQVDPVRRRTAQAVFDAPLSFFANPPIDGKKSARIPGNGSRWTVDCSIDSCVAVLIVLIVLCCAAVPQSASTGRSCSRT